MVKMKSLLFLFTGMENIYYPAVKLALQNFEFIDCQLNIEIHGANMPAFVVDDKNVHIWNIYIQKR